MQIGARRYGAALDTFRVRGGAKVAQKSHKLPVAVQFGPAQLIPGAGLRESETVTAGQARKGLCVDVRKCASTVLRVARGNMDAWPVQLRLRNPIHTTSILLTYPHAWRTMLNHRVSRNMGTAYPQLFNGNDANDETGKHRG